jgi:[protein-PII] uridylyltransferase
MESSSSVVSARKDSKRIAEIFRAQMQSSLQRHPPFKIGQEEINAHFEGMPARYWERVDEEELTWGLELVHKFLVQVNDPSSQTIRPVLDWRHCPERGFTTVLLCTWDRQGLLAKAAAAFSATKVNILSADAYTRKDHIVLDVFRVCNNEHGSITDTERLQQMLFLLEGALFEPPRFASMWALSAHKYHPRKALPVVNISWDHERSTEHTILAVETNDRIGLLYDILQTLAEAGINVAQAIIDTDDDLATDTFYLTDSHGGKIADPATLESIKELLTAAIKD